MKQNQTLKIVLIALFAALVCVATMLVPIPIPASGGYANAGDGEILMCAFLMGPVNAAFAAGIGSMPVSYTHLDVYKRQAQSRHSSLASSLQT